MPKRSRRKKIGRIRSKRRICEEFIIEIELPSPSEYEFPDEEFYESDIFFSNCFDLICCEGNEFVEERIEEPFDEAGASYIVLDKVYEDFTDSPTHYQQLKTECKHLLAGHGGFSFLSASPYVRYIQCYELEMFQIIQTCVTIDHSFSVILSVHGKVIDKFHGIWNKIPRMCITPEHVKTTLNVVSSYRVCPGNPDPQFQHLFAGNGRYAGYRDLIGVPSIRATRCSMLINKNSRCYCCTTYRRTLQRAKEKDGITSPDHNLSQKGDKFKSESPKSENWEQRQYAKIPLSENTKPFRNLQKYVLVTNNGVRLYKP